MIAFRNLKEILKITLNWERKLKDFYDVAELAMRNQETRDIVIQLRKKLLVKLEILEGVDLDRFGETAWVRYVTAYRDEDLIPVGKITRNASAADIFSHLLDYEQKLKDVYSSISRNLVNRNQKELFESLEAFKTEQIEEISNFMKHHQLDR